MSRNRTFLLTAGLIAAFLLVQWLVVNAWSAVVGTAEFGVPDGTAAALPGFLGELVVGVLHCAFFGLGVFLVLRFLAPVTGGSTWRHVIMRSIVATVSGAIIAFVFAVVSDLVSATTIGDYPFGYSFNAGINGNNLEYLVKDALLGFITPLIDWLPATVLGCVFLRLWLQAHPSTMEATDRASVSA